jgi:hypothetical protein
MASERRTDILGPGPMIADHMPAQRGRVGWSLPAPGSTRQHQAVLPLDHAYEVAKSCAAEAILC